MFENPTAGQLPKTTKSKPGTGTAPNIQLSPSYGHPLQGESSFLPLHNSVTTSPSQKHVIIAVVARLNPTVPFAPDVPVAVGVEEAEAPVAPAGVEVEEAEAPVVPASVTFMSAT